ncbi:MAG: hypothetical protein HDS77_09295 [Bacteroidales bacterium]|nr:hypothetical protein [Bacteroidales bacterium]MBD5211433.1 hypothetical protein [Bacteroidales bacterium]
MGKIPNKTYTAPDGTVYRVESDGSITKIKNGSLQSNEPPSKYQITPDGKIYRVESDGSVTYLGNAEERQQTPPPLSYETEEIPEKPKSKKWIGWLIVFAIIGLAIIAGVIYSESNKSYDYNNDYRYSDSTEAAVEETPAAEDAQYAFICEGNYNGSIGGTAIHGNLTLDTESPSGTLYYSNGNGEALSIYGSSDGQDWSEYYGESLTGTIHFDFWDLAYKNFARGTYTRSSDGKQFSIELYKSNF